MKRKFYIGLSLYVILLLPPIVTLLEKWMATHMLVQMPLLIVSGYLMGQLITNKYKRFFSAYNENGIPGILLVYFITMYWMIPRAMDEAIMLHTAETFKFISLPFLVGIFLYDSWPKLSEVAKSFLAFNYIPMFGIMAWLYIDSPIPICNNYLETEQKLLGWGFFIITLLMLLYVLRYAFVDQRKPEEV
ncbi:MAG TPA: hypothetical protein VK061_06010 [Bacillota bacterium]|nr:hypothetical protein [Bacillota bacterium]